MCNQTYPGEESSHLLSQSVIFQPLLFSSSWEADSPAASFQPWESQSSQGLVHCPKRNVLDVAQKTRQHQ